MKTTPAAAGPCCVAVVVEHGWARLFFVHADYTEAATVQGATTDGVLVRDFFVALGLALGDAEQVLLLGESTARLYFLQHAHRHDRALEARFVGNRSSAQRSEVALVAFARRYFDLESRLPLR